MTTSKATRRKRPQVSLRTLAFVDNRQLAAPRPRLLTADPDDALRGFGRNDALQNGGAAVVFQAFAPLYMPSVFSRTTSRSMPRRAPGAD